MPVCPLPFGENPRVRSGKPGGTLHFRVRMMKCDADKRHLFYPIDRNLSIRINRPPAAAIPFGSKRYQDIF
jgi:hypothetical protein